jgi:hypothetical protein
MDNDFFRKHKNFIYFSLILITLITIYPLFGTGFGCGDDIHDYITARKGDTFHNSEWLARIAGRFYYIFIYPIHVIPYLADNMFIVKLFQVIPILTCFIVFAMILYAVTKSKEFSLLFVLFSLSLSQISGHTSLFVTYPFFFTFSFTLLLLSCLFLVYYLENKKRRSLTWSVLLFFIAVLFYEVYVLYVLFVAMIIIAYKLKEEGSLFHRMKRSAILFLPYFLVAAAYLGAYVFYRHFHPSTYDGTTMIANGFKWGSFFNVLWSLSYTSIPLTVFDYTRTLFTEKSDLIQGFHPVVLQILIHARIEWIIKGILVGVITWMLLMNSSGTSIKFLLRGIGVAILIVFLPHLPLAMTSKYTYYTSVNMIGYVTTYFSLFGIMMLATLLINFLINLFSFNLILKKIMTVAVIITLVTISVMTDFTNYHITKDIHSANVRVYAIDELIKTEQFRQIPQSSILYSEELYFNASYDARNLTEQNFEWKYFILEKTKGYWNFIRDMKEFRDAAKDSTFGVYYVAMKQAVKTDDLLIAIGQINRSALKDSILKPYVRSALVLYYSTYKNFSLSFRCKNGLCTNRIPLYVEGLYDTIASGSTTTYNVHNTREFQKATVFTVKADSVDLRSIRITNVIEDNTRSIYLLQ